MANPQIVVEYVAKLDSLAAAQGKIGAQSSKVGGLARKAFLPAIGALAAIGAGAAKAVGDASDLTETINKSAVVFGDSADEILAWSETTAEGFGISQQAALDATGVFGDMFSQLGFGEKAAADSSQAMVELAGDLGSFHNVDPTDVLDRMSAAFRGEYDSIQALIPGINAARVEQEALEATGKKSAKSLTAQEKALAVQAILFEDSANAAGDAAETADTLAGRQRRLAAQTADLSAEMGTALLPVVEVLAGVLQKVADVAAKHPGIFKAVVAAVAALAAIIVILNVVMAITAAVSASVLLPVLAVVAAIAALIVIGVLLYKNWGKIKETAGRVWSAIKDAARSVLDWLRSNWPKILAVLAGPIGIAVLLIVKHWDRIKRAAKAAVDFIKGVWSGLVSFIRGLAGKVGSAVGAIVNAIKRPLNAIIGAWNDLAFTIPRVEIPDWVPGIGGKGFGPQTIDFPDIPKLARGGIVTGPTIALLGEAGPELVTPLGRRGGAAAIVNVDTLIVREEIDVARIVSQLSAAVAVRL